MNNMYAAAEAFPILNNSNAFLYSQYTITFVEFSGPPVSLNILNRIFEMNLLSLSGLQKIS